MENRPRFIEFKKEDYALWNRKTKKLEIYILYHYNSVIEMLNYGFQLTEDEEFIPANRLPIELQEELMNRIEKLNNKLWK